MAVDPSQMQQVPPEVLAALQAQGAPQAPGAPPEADPGQDPAGAPQDGSQDYSGADVDHASECILNAIVQGCENAALAEPGAGEDFMRFAQGVNQLVQALDNLHSPPAGITSPPPQQGPHPHEIAQGQANAAKTLMQAIQMPAELALKQQQAQSASRPTSART